jgi:hypothetical protein
VSIERSKVFIDGWRPSSYFVPIAKSKKKGSNQLQFDTEWTKDRIEENKLVMTFGAASECGAKADTLA